MLKQEPRLDKSDKEPERAFPDRSKELKTELHSVDPEGKEMAPEILLDFRVKDSSLSRVRRKDETTWKSVLKGEKLRSIEETLVSLHFTPAKAHGFRLGSHVWSWLELGKAFLKLSNCWASLLVPEDWWEREGSREISKRIDRE